jgi:hypothetical protein
MTAETIHTLARSIPDKLMPQGLLGGRTATSPYYGYDPDVHRFIATYRDVDFGWKFCCTAALHKLPFASSVLRGDDEVLWRAYLFCRDPKLYPSQDIKMAIGLASDYMRSTRQALHGFLLASDGNAVTAAADLGLPVDAVRAYEKLFFNVIDRKNDLAYIQSIVYPHGRLVELVEGYLQNEDIGAVIRRAGYNSGRDDVRFLIGSASSAVDALSRTQNPKQLENLMMAFAMVIARNGGLGQGITAMNNARQLLTAGKIGGETTADVLSGNISESIKPELQRWRSVQRSDAE